MSTTTQSEPARLDALAYTQGTEIHVAPGQERHLPHEAWHVVQQAQGRVQPTMQLQDVPVNDDQGLEEEADVMGAKASAIAAQRHTGSAARCARQVRPSRSGLHRPAGPGAQPADRRRRSCPACSKPAASSCSSSTAEPTGKW